MLSVGSVGVRPLTQPRIAFRGNDDDLEEQRQGVEELRETANSQDTPKLIRNAAGAALLVGVGALGYATFDKCAPKAWESIKKSYNKAVSDKNKAVVKKNVNQASQFVKKQVKVLDGKMLAKAEKSLASAKPDSNKAKMLKKSLDFRKTAQEAYQQSADWAKNKGPKALRKTMAVLTGSASAIETHQEMTERAED